MSAAQEHFAVHQLVHPWPGFKEMATFAHSTGRQMGMVRDQNTAVGNLQITGGHPTRDLPQPPKGT